MAEQRSGPLIHRLAALIGIATLIGCAPQAPEDSDIGDRVNAAVYEAYKLSNDDLHAAITLCRDAKDLADGGGTPRNRMYSRTCLARLLLEIPKFDESLRLHAEVLHLAEESGDLVYQAIALLNESEIFSEIGLHDWAEDRILHGLNRLGPTGNADIRYALWTNQSIVAREQGKIETSLSIIRRTPALLPSEHIEQLSIIVNEAFTLLADQRYTETLRTLERVADDVARRGEPYLKAEWNSAKGGALIGLGRIDEGLVFLKEGLDHARGADLEILTAEILIQTAQGRISASDHDGARRSLMDALEIGQKSGSLGITEKALLTLTRWKASQGDPTAAHDLDRLNETRRRLSEQENRFRAQGLKTIFEAEAKALELKSLQEQERARRKLTYALAAICVLLMVILIQVVLRARVEADLHSKIQADNREMKRLNHELVRAAWRELGQLNRISALGAMAFTFVHELQQPLTAILTNAQTARRSIQGPKADRSRLGDAVEDTIEAARWARDLMQRLRRLMQQGSVADEPLDLNEVIRDVEDLVSKEAHRKQVVFRWDRSTEPLPVRGDRIGLQQIVLNLIQNGIAANLEDPSSESLLFLRTGRPDPETIRLEVEDRGPKVEGAVLQRMFEPLFTTKSGGLGMGLALCRSIAEAHGGSIVADAAGEQGLTLSLTLPAAGVGPSPGPA